MKNSILIEMLEEKKGSTNATITFAIKGFSCGVSDEAILTIDSSILEICFPSGNYYFNVEDLNNNAILEVIGEKTVLTHANYTIKLF